MDEGLLWQSTNINFGICDSQPLISLVFVDEGLAGVQSQIWLTQYSKPTYNLCYFADFFLFILAVCLFLE